MATGYFGVSSTRLRDEVRQLDSRRAAAEEQAAELQRELERVRAATPAIPPLAATVLLRPPRRGLDTDAPVVTIARGTSEVVLRLVVETDAYARFWAAVIDSAASRAVWRSRDLSPGSDAAGTIVTVNLPASSLDAGRYVVDLFAMTPDGQGELIGQYPVRVVLE
jgi:hypothetical protein